MGWYIDIPVQIHTRLYLQYSVRVGLLLTAFSPEHKCDMEAKEEACYQNVIKNGSIT